MERPLLFQELGMTYDVQEESAVASATGNNGGGAQGQASGCGHGLPAVRVLDHGAPWTKLRLFGNMWQGSA